MPPAPAAESPAEAAAPRIAILAALHEELSGVLARWPDEQRERAAGRDVWRGHWHGREVLACLSRVGKVAAATTAALLIERYGAQAIVMTGVAGALHPALRVGDVVLARELLQHDMDASPLFPRHQVPLYGRSRFATDAPLSERLGDAARRALADPVATLGAEAVAAFALHQPAVHEGLIVSGDRFVATVAESAALRAELPDALAVDMEGAAVAQVCHDYGVPFAMLRTISDRADDDAHVDFPRFVEQVASHYSVAVLDRWLSMA